jgi:hypothetical protein
MVEKKTHIGATVWDDVASRTVRPRCFGHQTVVITSNDSGTEFTLFATRQEWERRCESECETLIS